MWRHKESFCGSECPSKVVLDSLLLTAPAGILTPGYYFSPLAGAFAYILLLRLHFNGSCKFYFWPALSSFFTLEVMKGICCECIYVCIQGDNRYRMLRIIIHSFPSIYFSYIHMKFLVFFFFLCFLSSLITFLFLYPINFLMPHVARHFSQEFTTKLYDTALIAVGKDQELY